MESVPPAYGRTPGFGLDSGAAPASPTTERLNLRFIDWIWRIRGSVPLPPGQSSDEAFDRLAPLFGESGTRWQRAGDTLTFTKANQAAQDKMSVFDGGALRIETAGPGAVLRYQLTSRALLACFLAPLLFLSLSQVTILIKKYDKPPAAAKKDTKKDEVHALNPIDKALGAPAPEKPKKGKDGKPKGDDDKKLSPKSGYVFAEIFAFLYVLGRILEDRLVGRLFRKHLTAHP